jgi:nucleoside-diphosphate-sugar epimerase|tara:strand:- start:8350 stop:10911 length:2562 start_codon:yes stop_codon:yes gene_type:complete
MKKKTILITGCLGYLGTEICKIYSGESWHHRIIGIDDKFFSGRVKQLRDWNIEFYQIEILDETILKELCQKSDVIHHLAGVTDVAYVKKQINKDTDKNIISAGIDGTKNVLKHASKNCKIIFPSTHVIFEGLKKTKQDIDETEIPCPVLTYSKTKVVNELDIIKSKKNYVILRLGSVYGYSEDNTRLKIMPNFFSKESSLNKSIYLHSGGKQLKSLVSIYDVARCFKFMEEKNIKNEIFNLTNENTTVKKVAEILKKINPNLKVFKNNYPIPNLGYTLSNKKIKRFKFKFLYSLKKSLNTMYKSWSPRKNYNPELEYKVEGKNEFADSRGKISNYELTEPINLIGLITSKKNTMRANHFHSIQEQKVLVTEGQFISVYQNLLEENSPKITHVINKNDSVVTKPNVAHTMVFSKQTTFLNLVRGEREHKNYGVTHTISHKIVSEKEKRNLLQGYKFNCRCCNSTKLKRVISLGFHAPANNLIKKKNDDIDKYPLELNFCVDCSNSQLSYVVRPEKLFSKYLYLSSTSSAFRKHFTDAANLYKKNLKLSPSRSIIVDIGSNDGIGLLPFKKIGFKNLIGVEPAKNIAKLANVKGIKTINSFMNKNIIKKINKKVDLVMASNVFAHTDKLDEMTTSIFSILKNSGTLTIEVQYLVSTLKDLSFDNIYHEHVNYWTLTSLKNYFNKFNAKIFNVEKINTHGGSIRVYLTKNKTKKINKNVNNLLKKEKLFGVNKFKTYEKFSKKIEDAKNKFVINLNKIAKDQKIIGYGAPAKASTMLNYFGINDNSIKYIIDDNPLKNNKIIPGCNIKIYNKNKIPFKPDSVVVLAWNFYKNIKKENKNLSKQFFNCRSLQGLSEI